MFNKMDLKAMVIDIGVAPNKKGRLLLYIDEKVHL